MRIMKPSRMVALLAIALFAVMLAACGRSSEPTATPVPPTEPPVPATETPIVVEAPATGEESEVIVVEDPWDRIQQEGKIVVGTSADYRPFEYYDDEFQIVGFDPSLMNAIAANLGLEVELRDFAFDGLGSALQVGQIDAAIAAISVTEEREAVVDFSQIYYVSEDALLAAEGASVTPINTLRDLVNVRIGVQRASVYEDLLQDNLVDTGLIPESNVHSYGDVDRAVDDLRNGLIDVVMLDFLVAEGHVEDGGVEIVAEGLNNEAYAIAFGKGAVQLQTEVNNVLALLDDTGVIDDLVQEHLDLEPEEIVPLPTPSPTPAQPVVRPPTPGCIDSMAWVSDLSYDDQNMTAPPVVTPGQPFRKGWRILNNGTCTWDSTYMARFVQGNVAGAQMGGQATPIAGTVPPGATYDLYIDLIAPLQPGLYQGVWQLFNGQNAGFGEKLWVAVAVPAGPTPTPWVTQTPAPGINFTVDRTNIKSGECVTFRWDVQNVNAVYFYSEGEDWRNNGVAGQGSRQECPTQDTTYYLRVEKRDGSVETRQIRIYVDQTVDAPRINRFSVDPSGQIPVNQCVALRWEVSGNVNQVDLFRNNERFWRDAPYSGSSQDCPPGPGSYEYRIKAQGPGGKSEAVEHVDVMDAPTTATPPPVTGPIITGLTVSPDRIQVGQCVNIAWSTDHTDSTRLSIDGYAIVDQGPADSSGVQDCPTGLGQRTYLLEAFNNTGLSDSASAPLLVEDGAQPTQVPPTATPDQPTPEPPTATPDQPTPEPPTATPEQPTPPPAAPVISNFSVDRNEISLGECVNLSWAFSGDSLALTQIFRNDQVWLTDVPSPGTQEDCPEAAGLVTYRLKVDSEFSGSAEAGQAVTVMEAEAVPLPAEPEPETQEGEGGGDGG